MLIMNIKEFIKTRLAGKEKTVLKKYTSVVIPAVLGLIIAIDVLVLVIVSVLHSRNTKQMTEQSIVMLSQSLKNTFDAYESELNILRKEYSEEQSPEDFLKKCTALLENSPLKKEYLTLSFPVTGKTYTSGPGKVSHNFRNTKAFAKIVKEGGKSYITIPPDLNRDIFEVALPVYGKRDSVAAVIAAGFSSEAIDSILLNTKSNGYGYVILGNYDYNFRFYIDGKIQNSSAKEMEQMGFKNVASFLDQGKLESVSPCYTGSYKTPEGIDIKCVVCVLPGTDIGVSINTPSLYLNMLINVILLSMIIITITAIILIRIAIKRITMSFVIKPLDKIKQFTSDFAEGKMYENAAASITSDDEFGDLKNSVEKMQDKVSDTVKQIRNVSKSIDKGNVQLKKYVKNIDSDAKKQVDYGNKIHNLIDEMTVSIQQNAQNALHTKEFSNMMAADMNNVTLASENTLNSIQIVIDKIKIIDEISERTDLLAINAAVEASRAGENGKGFGVVAAEIRKLAEHCLEASTEINESSNWSLKTTSQSVELIQQILPNIKDITEKISKISDICNRQLDMTYSISMSVMQLISIAANNSETADQISEYSDKLSHRINELNEATEFFKTQSTENSSAQKLIEEIHRRTSEILRLRTALLELDNSAQTQDKTAETEESPAEDAPVSPNKGNQISRDEDAPSEYQNTASEFQLYKQYKNGADIKLDDEYTEY